MSQQNPPAGARSAAIRCIAAIMPATFVVSMVAQSARHGLSAGDAAFGVAIFIGGSVLLWLIAPAVLRRRTPPSRVGESRPRRPR